tara:strand:- start:7506 stop:7748 length:243 start_codon:yes stop_codon:yes gene_type:complete
MKKLLAYISLILLLITSCNDQTTKENSTVSYKIIIPPSSKGDTANNSKEFNDWAHKKVQNNGEKWVANEGTQEMLALIKS